MYKEFYSFRCMPFTETTDNNPNFVHLSKNYEMPLAILVSSFDKGVTLALVVGANGVGKSTFINYIRKHIEQNLSVGVITTGIHSCEELLQKALACFGPEAKITGIGEMVRQLREFLSIQFKKQNQQPSLLIIDDADSMTLDAIKSLELLLDLNSDNNRILQVVLVGRYHLRELLNKPELQGLLNRVETQCSLEPLTVEETRSYIVHRLNIAGMPEQKLFNEEVCTAIHEYSEGIPGKINLICDEALLRSSRQQKHEVSAALIREVTSGDVQEQRTPEQMIALQRPAVPTTSENRRRHLLFNAALVGGGILAGFFLISVFAPDRFPFSPEKPVDLPQNPAQISEEKTYPDSLAGKETAENENIPSSEKKTAKYLFGIADGHLQALRLTTPKGKNALDIYRSILKDDPDNKMAHQGIKRVAKKYRELAEYELQKGAFDKASSYLELAEVIHPESEEIKKALLQARKLRNQAETGAVKKQQTPHTLNKTVTSSKGIQVEKLLAVAEQQFAASKLMFPSNDNAYETYITVLSIAPKEERVLAGLLRITNHYLELAKKHRAEGRLNQSLRFISRGLKVSPDHEELAVIKSQVDDELKLQLQKNKIGTMVKLAEQQVSRLKLINPQGDNAYQTYQTIIAIDKENQEAKQGLQKIQQRLKSQVQDALDKQNFVTVQKLSKQIIAIPSYGVGNRYHKEVLFAAFETKEIIEDQLEHLLSLAEQQRKTQHLTRPPGDNAFESYHKVLEIDSTNETAIKGLSSLVEQYQTMVEDALSDDRADQAMKITNEGLEAFPDNKDLRAIQDSVVVQRDADLKQTKEKPAEKKVKKLRPFSNF